MDFSLDGKPVFMITFFGIQMNCIRPGIISLITHAIGKTIGFIRMEIKNPKLNF
jgi:hypothetical protein